MLPEKINRIALIGPESSGKTTLCKLLSEHYKTQWVPEYARDYIEKLNRPYNSDDILLIAKEQMKVEDKMVSKAIKFLFADTELIIAKTWCEDVFGFYPGWMDEKIEERKYDLYLLTKPDLPWENDPVRENPNRRDYFFDLYLNEIRKREFNYEIISGTGDQRFLNAVTAIEKFNLFR